MLPKESAARKRIPIFSGLFKYFPDALCAVAELSFEANEKHNPGEPVHWSREKSNDHPDCVGRHMIDFACGDRRALREAAWRVLAVLQLDIEANGPIRSNEYDPRVAPYEPPGPPTLKAPDDYRSHFGLQRPRVLANGDYVEVALRDGDTLEGTADTFAWNECGPNTIVKWRRKLKPAHRVGEIGACDCAVCIGKAAGPDVV